MLSFEKGNISSKHMSLNKTMRVGTRVSNRKIFATDSMTWSERWIEFVCGVQ